MMLFEHCRRMDRLWRLQVPEARAGLALVTWAPSCFSLRTGLHAGHTLASPTERVEGLRAAVRPSPGQTGHCCFVQWRRQNAPFTARTRGHQPPRAAPDGHTARPPPVGACSPRRSRSMRDAVRWLHGACAPGNLCATSVPTRPA